MARPGKTHLFIPDPHAHPDYKNVRFDKLGKVIYAIQPDVVICAGDFFDMASLCSYDSSTKKVWEARSYERDINAGLDAQDRLWHPYRKAKKRLPYRVFTVGNHEWPRIDRLLEANSILAGTVGRSDLQLEHYWDDVIPFLDPWVVDGVAYSHYFVSGVMGRSISGERPAVALLNKGHMSSTQGHTHTFDYAIRHSHTGKPIMGLVGGCFVDYKSEWNNSQAEAMWWSGVVVKRNVKDGVYDMEMISTERIMNYD